MTVVSMHFMLGSFVSQSAAMHVGFLTKCTMTLLGKQYILGTVYL